RRLREHPFFLFFAEELEFLEPNGNLRVDPQLGVITQNQVFDRAPLGLDYCHDLSVASESSEGNGVETLEVHKAEEGASCISASKSKTKSKIKRGPFPVTVLTCLGLGR